MRSVLGKGTGPWSVFSTHLFAGCEASGKPSGEERREGGTTERSRVTRARSPGEAADAIADCINGGAPCWRGFVRARYERGRTAKRGNP